MEKKREEEQKLKLEAPRSIMKNAGDPVILSLVFDPEIHGKFICFLFFNNFIAISWENGILVIDTDPASNLTLVEARHCNCPYKTRFQHGHGLAEEM